MSAIDIGSSSSSSINNNNNNNNKITYQMKGKKRTVHMRKGK